MTQSETEQPAQSVEEEIVPLFAPSRKLELQAPFRWFLLGWQDFKRAPVPSLAYGIGLVLFSYLLTYLFYTEGNVVLLFTLLVSFVLVGPILAFALYTISCQLQSGQEPTLIHCCKENKRHIMNELFFAVLLLVILLIWARAASMVHIFFPMEDSPGLIDWLIFFGIGSGIGAVFAGIVFTISAFSLPMMLDRGTDAVTASLTSINAVLKNKLVMLVWASIIFTSFLASFATAYLGLAVLMPVLGFAAWHGYRDTILECEGTRSPNCDSG